jgi:hypothetical protein
MTPAPIAAANTVQIVPLMDHVPILHPAAAEDPHDPVGRNHEESDDQ